jgi:hypothetical protein
MVEEVEVPNTQGLTKVVTEAVGKHQLTALESMEHMG